MGSKEDARLFLRFCCSTLIPITSRQIVEQKYPKIIKKDYIDLLKVENKYEVSSILLIRLFFSNIQPIQG